VATLPRRYPHTWSGWPPAMPYGDRQVWTLFLEQHGAEWPEYAYDVELHGGDRPSASDDAVMNRTWARLTAKRVDAVGIRAGRVTLFEIRHNAAWQSLGQLVGYRDLWPRDFPELQLEGAAIVTDAIDPQIRAVAERQGLQVLVV
jgi:hypothetical protein